MATQALSKAEGGTKNELDSLEAEADMPLEQLLAQYGYVMGGIPNPTPDIPNPTPDDIIGDMPESSNTGSKAKAKMPAGSAERPAKRQRVASTGDAHSSKPEDALSPAQLTAQDSGPQSSVKADTESDSDRSADLRELLESPEAAMAVDDNKAPSNRAGSKSTGKAAQEEEVQDLGPDSHSESDFDSAAGSDAGVDDEQTLDEEERMAHADGAAHHVSDCFFFFSSSFSSFFFFLFLVCCRCTQSVP